MYIPKHNMVSDTQEKLAFMRQYNFATIVSAKDNIPTATHLPFVTKEEGDTVVLYAHCAKANNHWKDFENNTVMVIFAEPHAYVSTRFYEQDQDVPTWNYTAVHAYGKVKLIETIEGKIALMETSIEAFDASYKEQWNRLDEKFKLDMLRGIVAFKVTITDLQAKKKLSQNRSEEEKRRIIEAFSKSSNANEKEIAEQMKKIK